VAVGLVSLNISGGLVKRKQRRRTLENQNKKIKQIQHMATCDEGLANVFLLLYTKLKSLGVPMRSDSKARVITAAILLTTSRLSRLLLPVVAFGLLAHFRKSQREAYMDIDTKITFAIYSTVLVC
jgi:hypothetical protein